MAGNGHEVTATPTSLLLRRDSLLPLPSFGFFFFSFSLDRLIVFFGCKKRLDENMVCDIQSVVF
jgi:hypothetical protein